MTQTTEPSTPWRADDYEYHVAWSQEDNLYIGRVTEFSMLSAHGESLEEALAEIKSVVEFVLEDMADAGDPIPEPLSKREFSGKFNVRLPRELHRELVADAARQGVSLNTLLIARLARRS